VLVVDHGSGEVLAWAVGGGGDPDGPRTYIDAVTTPRQPGSALKPFLYALALDRGWSPAEIIDDAPLTESTSGGLHSYQNYSRRFYGPVTLRDALGNSLNIPALKTLQYVGAEAYLDRLHALGFRGLDEHPDFYGDGIALGSGAVTLLDLVGAYAALANAGVYRPLSVLRDDARTRTARRVFSAEAASLIGNILSDPAARTLEFGRDSVLNLPVQTAVKTGTSSDFRDAWAVGFDYRYAVGVWMGNLDDTASDGVTGSTGPALLLRSVFASLERGKSTERLYLSPRLAERRVCVPLPESAAGGDGCIERDEWFLPGGEPAAAKGGEPAERAASVSTADRGLLRPAGKESARSSRPEPIRLRQPTPGLRLAYDPRLPADAQVFRFVLDGAAPDDRVDWVVDGETVSCPAPEYRWAVTRGEHRVSAAVRRGGALVAEIPEVAFEVK
ncbi:MAG TPA: penicillin-binding transpeptidase domain-containing protein, partial [Gammaproteobacteria bacterium]|nr:penicillin-binding transpeptidase domain-containing protein [Gammaproteobacteria bacterium]